MRKEAVIGVCIGILIGGLGFAVFFTQAKVTDEVFGETVQSDSEAGGDEPAELETRDVAVETATGTSGGTGMQSAGIQTFLESLGIDAIVGSGEVPGEENLTDAVPGSKNPEETPDEESQQEDDEYADLAIANVSNYVNVRSAPNTDGEIVGKIYNGAVAQILELAGEENDWFQIVSGDVEGYIKSEFFLYGDDAVAVIDDYVTRYATVIASRLNVREEPDIESSRVGYMDNGERVQLLEDQGEWLKVQYTDNATGYVAAEYVTLTEEFVYAKTLEEEARELAEKRALEERQRVSETQAAENTTITVAPPVITYSTNSELRQQIVDYAMQFLGNKYVHGGRSLEGGTDCSGFTSLIYAQFGYSLSRTPEGQLSGAGRGIDYSEIQPGDILCYGSGGRCTHVAMYIGDGQIIHSANPRKGVVTQGAGFDTILGVRNIVD